MTYGDYIVIAKRNDGTLFSDIVSSDTPKSAFREVYRHSAYDIVEVIPEPIAELEKIAADKLLIESLKTRECDDLDFHNLGVWSIRAALRAAYTQGRKDAMVKELEHA